MSFTIGLIQAAVMAAATDKKNIERLQYTVKTGLCGILHLIQGEPDEFFML